MITPQDIIDALTKCSGYDSAHTPQPSQIVVEAWIEHFSDFPGVIRDDLLRSVKEYHREPHDVQLQPAHISGIARKYVRERYERSELDSPERLRLEAMGDAKAAPEAAIEAAHSTAGGELEPGAVGGSGKEVATVTEAPARQDRSAEIAAFAKKVGKPPEAINQRYVAAMVAQQRAACKPVLPPCPECGSVDPCEHDKQEELA